MLKNDEPWLKGVAMTPGQIRSRICSDYKELTDVHRHQLLHFGQGKEARDTAYDIARLP
jgi:hypothetical protein